MVHDRGSISVSECSFAAAGTASEARAWSLTFDSLIGNHISQAFQGTFSPYMPYFSVLLFCWPGTQTFLPWAWCCCSQVRQGSEIEQEEWGVEGQLGCRRLGVPEWWDN